MKRPQPVVVTVLCSLCDLSWDAHGEKPTTEDCIRLLKAELRSRPKPIPYWYNTPVWNGLYASTNTLTASASNPGSITYMTPKSA